MGEEEEKKWVEKSEEEKGGVHMNALESLRMADSLCTSTNLAVQIANGQITHSARYAQVQPKMCPDGRFPSDFRMAKTLEEVIVLDRMLLPSALPAPIC